MTKHNVITWMAAACIAFAAHAQRPLKWIADATQTAPVTFDCSRGETLTFAPVLKAYGTTLTNYTASFQWQTNGMGGLFWSTNALVFAPSMDVGASRYRFWIRAETTNGVMYSAQGTINMLHAPGAIVNALPLPVSRIDFSAVAYANAPWLLTESDPGIPAAIAQAGTNAQAIASAAQSAAIAFATTNPVTRLSGTSNEWISIVNGTGVINRVEQGVDYLSATLTVTEALTIDGSTVVLPAGTYTSLPPPAGRFVFIYGEHAFGYEVRASDNPFNGSLYSYLVYQDDTSAWYGHNNNTGEFLLPDDCSNIFGTAISGRAVVAFATATVTNSYPLYASSGAAGLSGAQVTNIFQTIVYTNQFWASPATNILIREYWDITNRTFAVEEITP